METVIYKHYVSGDMQKERRVTRRGWLAVTSVGVVGLAGCTDSDNDEPETASADEDDDAPTASLTVGPEDDITEAIDELPEGGQLELEAGLYQTPVEITKPLSLVGAGPGETTFEIDDEDEPGTAVRIGADTVEIADLDVFGTDTAISTLEETNPVDDVTVRNVEMAQCSTGIVGEFDSVELHEIVVEEASSVAMRLNAGRDGAVTIDDAEISFGSEAVVVSGGNDHTLKNIDCFSTGGDGIRIEDGDARQRTVEFADLDMVECDGNGVTVEPTGDDDEVIITSADVIDNGGFGIDIEADDVELEEILAEENGPANAGVRVISSRDGTVTATDVTVEQTEDDRSFGSGPRGRGLTITDGDTVTLENITTFQNNAAMVWLDTEEARDQTISLTDVEIDENSTGAGLHITGTSGDDDVSLSDILVENCADHAITVSAETIDLTDVEARNNGPTQAAIQLTSGSDGDVTLTDVSVYDTGRNRTFGSGPRGRGVLVEDGKTVTVDGFEARDNGSNHLRIVPESVRGQTIDIEDADVDGTDAGSGIATEGTAENDEITIRSSVSNNSGNYGYVLAGETVTIEDSSASGNESGGLSLRDIDQSEANISNSDLE